MINIHCSNCSKSFAQVESGHIKEVLDNIKVCPICGNDYVTEHGEVLCLTGQSVYLKSYKHPVVVIPTPVPEPVAIEPPPIKREPESKPKKEATPKKKPIGGRIFNPKVPKGKNK